MLFQVDGRSHLALSVAIGEDRHKYPRMATAL
jgi:hypothetical protein